MKSSRSVVLSVIILSAAVGCRSWRPAAADAPRVERVHVRTDDAPHAAHGHKPYSIERATYVREGKDTVRWEVRDVPSGATVSIIGLERVSTAQCSDADASGFVVCTATVFKATEKLPQDVKYSVRYSFADSEPSDDDPVIIIQH